MGNILSSMTNLIWGKPTLQFHRICGMPVALLGNSTIARRHAGFENGVVFVQQPFFPNQPVSIQIMETSNLFSGTLYVGFTSMSPDRIPQDNMTSDKVRDWADRATVMWMRGIFAYDLKRGSILSFYFDANGSVKYTVDGSEQEILLQVGNVTQPLWAVFDVYGGIVGIKLVDMKVEIEEPEPQIAFKIRQSSIPPTPPIQPGGQDANATPEQPTRHETKECVICMNEVPDVAFVSCGHICICRFCAKGYRKKLSNEFSNTPRCPICRRVINRILRTFQV